MVNGVGGVVLPDELVELLFVFDDEVFDGVVVFAIIH